MEIDMFKTDSILPPPPPGARPILHDREYRIRAYHIASDRLLIQGAIRDQKPPGLYLRGDPDPMTIHHMQLSIEVGFPSLEIVGVNTDFETHPHGDCPGITTHYQNLIGLSIARGFTHKVRELFGGPRGCTHVTALLQAMAPVAMQCFWSMRQAEAHLNDEPDPMLESRDDNDSWKRIMNTCHVWDENGPHVAHKIAGEPEPPPLWIQERAKDLGIIEEIQ
ncbi:MAG: DUF2889 domain-containing protein [Actinomycetia bacterium]|nr:DUF2889 domain-containing protein [Actinomycetes bacterium]